MSPPAPPWRPQFDTALPGGLFARRGSAPALIDPPRIDHALEPVAEDLEPVAEDFSEEHE